MRPRVLARADAALFPPLCCAQDTFLDAAHLESCFPGRAISFVNVAPGAVPAPPFRVTFPELQPRADAAPGKRKADDAATDAATEPLLVEVRARLSACSVSVCLGPQPRGAASDDTLCS